MEDKSVYNIWYYMHSDKAVKDIKQSYIPEDEWWW